MPQSHPCLPDPRQHAEPFLLILSPKILSIPRLLLPRPDAHLRHRHRSKENRAPAPRHQRDPNPRYALKHVIRTRHQPKAQTLRYPSLCPARRAQIPQCHVVG